MLWYIPDKYPYFYPHCHSVPMINVKQFDRIFSPGVPPGWRVIICLLQAALVWEWKLRKASCPRWRAPGAWRVEPGGCPGVHSYYCLSRMGERTAQNIRQMFAFTVRFCSGSGRYFWLTFFLSCPFSPFAQSHKHTQTHTHRGWHFVSKYCQTWHFHNTCCRWACVSDWSGRRFDNGFEILFAGSTNNWYFIVKNKSINKF